MKNILITLFVFGIVGCASVPPEQQLISFFNKQAYNSDIASDPELARWAAFGFLNGVIYLDHPNRNRIFANVEINKSKGIKIFEELNKNGDKVSQANLGIIYRNGNGVDQDLRKSIDLLQPVKDDYFDAAGEYAVAIHQMLKMNLIPEGEKKYFIDEMLSSLELSAANNYIPAHNSLSQLYREGIYISTDLAKSNFHLEKSKVLAEKKIRLARNITESRMLISQYSKTFSDEASRFATISMIVSFGAIGAMSYSQGFQQCSVGCSPPSVTDLLNWGVL
mgnify:CR=1 FL=1